MNKIFYASLAPLLLAACGDNTESSQTANADNNTGSSESGNVMQTDGSGQSTATNAVSGEATPTSAVGYATKAAASDLFEIESSKAVLASTTDAGTKKFAQMMLEHHTQSTAKIMAAAKATKLTLTPARLEPMQQQMLNEIKSADAAGVDRVYIKHQATAHQAALALHQGYARNGDTDAFKKAAGEITPVVQKHIAELDKMASM